MRGTEPPAAVMSGGGSLGLRSGLCSLGRHRSPACPADTTPACPWDSADISCGDPGPASPGDMVLGRLCVGTGRAKGCRRSCSPQCTGSPRGPSAAPRRASGYALTSDMAVGQAVQEAQRGADRLGDGVRGRQVGKAAPDLLLEPGPPLAELAPRCPCLSSGAWQLVGAQDDEGHQQHHKQLGRV